MKTKQVIYSLMIIASVMLTVGCKKKKNDPIDAIIPTLTTENVTSITSATSISGGLIGSDGDGTITSKGVCWSTNPNPTTSDSKTNDGNGRGNFTSNITGLNPNTVYYVRAYATNVAGTGYGNSITFKTYTGSITDIDNNVYNTVTIGNQIWMAENLKVTKYRNGDPVSNETNNTQWGIITSGAYCFYYHNVSNIGTYGLLYNWYAVNDNRGLAPTGWHVASDAEWTTLINYLNSINNGLNLGKSLASKSGWDNSTTSGYVGNDQASNNSSGFTALPSGYHSKDGNFYFLQQMGNWWTSTELDSIHSYFRDIYYEGGGVIRTNTYKQFGYSVRCIKD